MKTAKREGEERRRRARGMDTCMRSLTRSSGAVRVLAAAPEMAPAEKRATLLGTSASSASGCLSNCCGDGSGGGGGGSGATSDSFSPTPPPPPPPPPAVRDAREKEGNDAPPEPPSLVITAEGGGRGRGMGMGMGRHCTTPSLPPLMAQGT